MPLGWMFQPFQRQKPGQDSSRWRPHQAHWPADAFSLLNFKVLEFAPDAPTGAKDWNQALTTTPPMPTEEAAAILAWLDSIGENNPAIIAEVMTKCQRDMVARFRFLNMAGEIA